MFKEILVGVKEYLSSKVKNRVTSVSTIDGKVVEPKGPKDHPVLIKMRNNEDVTRTELNLLLSDLYDVKALEDGLFKFRKTLIDEAVFDINSIKLLKDKDEEYITLELVEKVFGLKAVMYVSPSDLRDIFDEISIRRVKDERPSDPVSKG